MRRVAINFKAIHSKPTSGIRAAILQTRKLDEITPATKANASAGAGALTAAVVGAVTRESGRNILDMNAEP